MQDVPQIEAFSIPIHVELTELMELHFDFLLNCGPFKSTLLRGLLNGIEYIAYIIQHSVRLEC